MSVAPSGSEYQTREFLKGFFFFNVHDVFGISGRDNRDDHFL